MNRNSPPTLPLSLSQPLSLPLHGGDIISASERYNIPIEEWIDLSTGINPAPYPFRDIGPECFSRLPYIGREFNQAVSGYYDCENFVAVTGTQAAIQILPSLLKKLPILVPEVGYQEHVKHWTKSQTPLNYYPSLDAGEMLKSIDRQLADNKDQHLLVINPNNPTTVKISKSQLITWAQQLAEGAYVIVDEAFMDLTPEGSVLTEKSRPENVIVLRSFGKFFGLAGIRLGFVFANDLLLKALENALGLWQVNGPAQAIAIQALNDKTWQSKVIDSIAEYAAFTRQIFSPVFELLGVEVSHHEGLFSSYSLGQDQALWLNEKLAQSGVLTRVVLLANKKALLRVGVLSPKILRDARKENIEKKERLEKVIDACCEALRSNSKTNEK